MEKYIIDHVESVALLFNEKIINDTDAKMKLTCKVSTAYTDHIFIGLTSEDKFDAGSQTIGLLAISIPFYAEKGTVLFEISNYDVHLQLLKFIPSFSKYGHDNVFPVKDTAKILKAVLDTDIIKNKIAKYLDFFKKREENILKKGGDVKYKLPENYTEDDWHRLKSIQDGYKARINSNSYKDFKKELAAAEDKKAKMTAYLRYNFTYSYKYFGKESQAIFNELFSSDHDFVNLKKTLENPLEKMLERLTKILDKEERRLWPWRFESKVKRYGSYDDLEPAPRLGDIFGNDYYTKSFDERLEIEASYYRRKYGYNGSNDW